MKIALLALLVAGVCYAKNIDFEEDEGLGDMPPAARKAMEKLAKKFVGGKKEKETTKREADIARLQEGEDRLEEALSKLVADIESKRDAAPAPKKAAPVPKKAPKNEIEIDEETKDHNGHVLVEGDIVRTAKTERIMNNKGDDENAKRDAATYGKWPGGVVVYDDTAVNHLSDLMAAFNAAVADFQAKSCIKFRKRISSDTSYISMIKGGGCWSYIGRTGSAQQLSIGSGCQYKGIVIHEFMHALGFYHEQSRLDRDDYIIIDLTKIRTGTERNFQKYSTGDATTHNQFYDKQSIMHYDNTAFSTDGSNTITSISNPSEKLGQREGLSAIDIKQLNLHYSCATPATDAPAPATDAPATDAPTEEPQTEEPKTEEPKTEEPGTEEPKTEEPATEEPATEKPVPVYTVAPTPSPTTPGRPADKGGRLCAFFRGKSTKKFCKSNKLVKELCAGTCWIDPSCKDKNKWCSYFEKYCGQRWAQKSCQKTCKKCTPALIGL